MADALVSPPVALTAGATAIVLIAVASKKVSRIRRDDIVPLMGVLGAFVFAAQMINFTIPGTGSSGHIIGGILLAALLGPWAAFITLSSVLIIQCLIFADGGLMALGCNLLNMAAVSCLLAYPLIFKPISGRKPTRLKLIIASVLASVVSLEIGAILVTSETKLSGITALSTEAFLGLMTSIHLAIGFCEGIATAVILSFVDTYQSNLLYSSYSQNRESNSTVRKKFKITLLCFGIATILMAGGFTWLASEKPDGLEWSIEGITGKTELADSVNAPTAIMPDYDSTLAGIVGGLIVMAVIWGICALLFNKRAKTTVH